MCHDGIFLIGFNGFTNCKLLFLYEVISIVYMCGMYCLFSTLTLMLCISHLINLFKAYYIKFKELQKH